VFKEDVIERGPLNMDGLWLTVEPTFAEQEPGAQGAVPQLEARPQFPQKASPLQDWQHTISLKIV
jgi:hypothetical protein